MAGSTAVAAMFLAAGGASLLLAIAILVLAIRHRAARALVMVLASHAMWMLPYGAGMLADDPITAKRLWSPFPYGVLLFGLPALYFAMIFPKPRFAGLAGRLAWIPLTLFGLAGCIAVALDGSLFFTQPAIVADPVGPMYDDGTVVGPLGGLAVPVNHLLVLTAAVMLTATSLRIRDSGTRRLAALATVGVLAPVLGGCGALATFTRLQNPTPFLAGSGPLLVVDALAVVEVIVLGLLITFLVRQTRSEARRTARGVLWATIGFLAVMAAIVASAHLLQDQIHPGYIITGFFATSLIVGDLLLGYAVLRRQVFDLDRRIKWSIRGGTVAAVFLAVFFVVTELAASLFSEALGLPMGLAAAGLLFFAMTPLMRAAQRVSDATMPRVAPLSDLEAIGRIDLYRQQVFFALSDGAMTDDERRMLDFMRRRLAISATEARRIEADVQAV